VAARPVEHLRSPLIGPSEGAAACVGSGIDGVGRGSRKEKLARRGDHPMPSIEAFAVQRQ
jgi:hypothetical protein